MTNEGRGSGSALARTAARSQSEAPAPPSTVTISIPPITVPAAVHMHEPAPLIVTRVNAGYVGMTAAELLRALRAMSADPRFRHAVIRYGKSFRGAPPDAIVAFLRADLPASTNGAEPASSTVDNDLLAAAGYEILPRARVAGGPHA